MEGLVTEFNGKLAQHLEYGQYFEIDVMAIEQPRSFHISLATQKLNEAPDSDIGIQILVDFFEETIFSKSRYSHNWTVNMSAVCTVQDHGKKSIKIAIFLSDTSFHVSLNGVHKLRTFYHFSVDQLKAIQIAGDIKLITRMDHRKVYPMLWPPATRQDGLAFSNDIPIRLEPGHLMVITARCYGNADGQLAFNIKHAFNATQLLHFNLRFASGTVVRNSLVMRNDNTLGYIYGSEESIGGFPFEFHKPFRMGIGFRTIDLIVAVNGLYFCTFAYREQLKNDLSNMVGVQIVGANGTGIKITEIDHIRLHDAACSNMESYTKLGCDEVKKK